MTLTCLSRNGVRIRLPDERWIHIVEEHSELAGQLEAVLDTVESAATVYEGAGGELLAVREIDNGKYLVAVYRETGATDGFVITAFLTRRVTYLVKRRCVWPPSTQPNS